MLENPPQNSSIQYDFLLPISQYPRYEHKLQRWTNFIGSAYVLLNENSNITDLESKTLPFVQKYFGAMIKRNQERGRMSKVAVAMQLHFQPITDMHLDTSIGLSEEPASDPVYSYILSSIALLILSIACINFVTLAIGRSNARTKEVGVRKVLGAMRLQLMKQFWGEALFLSFFALVLGIVLAELFLPTFNQLAAKELSLKYFSGEFGILGFVVLLLFVALFAGSYPAAYLSRFQPVEVFKGRIKLGGQNLLSRGLVIFQFGLSIFLIICTFLMSAQHSFMMNKNLGFNSEQVLVIKSYAGSGKASEELLERFRKELSAFPEIKGVSGTSSSFNRGWSINGFEHEGKNRSVFVYRVDYDYLDVLDIKIKGGRNFLREMATDADEAIIVNETFVREFEWSDPAVGKRLTGWNKTKLPDGPAVIGVVKDYHFLSLHQEIKPVMLMLDPEWPLGDFLVKINTSKIPATIDQIEDSWRKVAPNTPFTYSFLDQDLERQYRKEQRWARIVSYSSLSAILLACLGLFGLATLSASRRTKELGIRKVLGASFRSIVFLMSSEFTKLVLLANLIAVPIAWFAMDQWLRDFSYRIEIGLWIFVTAGVAALVIALATVSTQAIRAALANPVESLRYE